MDFDGNFTLIGRFDIDAVRAHVASFSEDEWSAMPWQDRIGREHRHTQTIPVLFDKDFRHENPSRHAAYDGMAEVVGLLEDRMKAHYRDATGYFIRMIVVRMGARSEIPLHFDTGSSLPYSHRIHLPIQTNPLVTFQIGEECRHLGSGELWEINNQRRHGVFNRSDESRTHVIMDWVTSDLLRRRQRELGLDSSDIGTSPKEDSTESA